MGQTLAEKILSAKSGRAVKAGDIAIVELDLAWVADSSGPLAFREMEDMGLKIAHPERSPIFLDHAVPPPLVEYTQEFQFLRSKAEQYGLKLYDMGSGICHQIVLEELAVPGGVTVGADSHTCTAGALCSFATGMGASDMAVAMGTGKTWMRVPETIEIHLTGKLSHGIFAKDLVLELERILHVDGATYMSLEFTGEGVASLGVSERATVSNMAVEMGGKVGLFPSDERTKEWMAAYGRDERWKPIPTDADAIYERTLNIDLSNLEPVVACPHQPDNVKPISEMKGTRIDHVFIGTCTNARLDDLAIAAQVLKGHKINPKTRLVVVPASRSILIEATKRGYLLDLIEAGATIGAPGCGACFGANMGIPGDGENVLSTQNRNFKARMGNAKASIYLGSPAVAAAAALTGMITDPREVL